MLISGAVAAMMSTADSQLLVATASLTEDIYVKLFRRGRPVDSPGQLVFLGRLFTLAVTGVALALAFSSQQLIFEMVAYAWSGLGSSFGPVILLTIWWKKMTRGGVMGGLVVGLVSTVVWQNSDALRDILDIKAASFLLSMLAVITLSLAGVGDRVRNTRV
jgi:sodium/proline symporter